MKKKVLIIVLAGSLMYAPQVRSMGWIDFCATWLGASYAYHAWCQWTQAHQMKPAKDVINELRYCLKELRKKVVEEQQDIKQCQADLVEIKNELDRYKDRLGVAS
ncbi:MAG: hypothetical protein ACJAZS_000757 [Alteromonas naphthalenivorans]|jgi:hypothetical protein